MPELRIVADKVVGFTWKFIQAAHLRMRIGPREVDMQGGPTVLFIEYQNGVGRGQIEGIPICMRKESDTVIDLAHVSFKCQWNLAVIIQR